MSCNPLQKSNFNNRYILWNSNTGHLTHGFGAKVVIIHGFWTLLPVNQYLNALINWSWTFLLSCRFLLCPAGNFSLSDKCHAAFQKISRRLLFICILLNLLQNIVRSLLSARGPIVIVLLDSTHKVPYTALFHFLRNSVPWVCFKILLLQFRASKALK